MKPGFVVAVILALGSMLFASCVQKTYYNADPNNNNNNGNNTLTFDEEFNGPNNYGWAFTDTLDSSYAVIANGYYQYVDSSKVLSSSTVINTGVLIQNNFSVKARISTNHIMGVVFGASATDNGYVFYIDSSGNYSLYKEGTDSTAAVTVIASTRDSLAYQGNWNILEVDQNNGLWNGFINGSQIFQLQMKNVTGSNFGFKVLPGTVGYADYIVVKVF